MKCEEKKRYKTEGDALVAASIALRKPKNTRTLRTYLCPKCNGWHLTSKTERSHV